MKIAILLSGQPRFTQEFQLFLDNLVGYDQADWFVYMTNNNHDPFKDNRIKIPETWINYEIDWARETITRNLPPNNFLRRFEISNVHEQIFPTLREEHLSGNQAIFKMHYNIFKTNQLREEYETSYNFKYDAIVRARPDVGLNQIIDLRKFDLSTRGVFMPCPFYGHPGRESNDLIGFGNSEVMSIYSNALHHFKEYSDAGEIVCPETLLSRHLITNNVSRIKSDFSHIFRTLPLDPKWF